MQQVATNATSQRLTGAAWYSQPPSPNAAFLVLCPPLGAPEIAPMGEADAAAGSFTVPCCGVPVEQCAASIRLLVAAGWPSQGVYVLACTCPMFSSVQAYMTQILSVAVKI